MSAVLNKTFQYVSHSLQASLLHSPGPGWALPEADAAPDAHLPPALAQFLEALHRCRTRQEERALAERHLAQVEARLAAGDAAGGGGGAAAVADALVRALACHALGIRADFAKIYALQLAQKGSTLEKKMGYLACTLLLKDSDEETLLLVNTLVKDLGGKNVVEVNIALTAMAYLVPPEMAAMVVPILLEKTTHSKDFIRKKSLVCIQQLIAKNPAVTDQVSDRVFSCLSDPDPGVVAVAVQVARTVCQHRMGVDGDGGSLQIIPVLLGIQGQVLGDRLPKEYVRRGNPAPWFQVDILRLLALILSGRTGQEDGLGQSVLDAVDSTLERTLESSSSYKETCAQAVTLECVRLTAVLDGMRPSQKRTSRALNCAVRFLQSRHNNVRYTGLECLECLLSSGGTKIARTRAFDESVMDCLDHADDSVQRKALSLLQALADADNAKAVCSRLLDCLRRDDGDSREKEEEGGDGQNDPPMDEFRRADLVEKVTELVDRFGGDCGLDWRVRTLLRLLQSSADGAQREELMERLKRSVGPPIAKGKAETKEMRKERVQVGWKLTKVLARNVEAEGKGAHVSVLRLYFWCLSHFYAVGKDEPENLGDASSVASKICRTGLDSESFSKSPLVLASCLEAVFTLLPDFGDARPPPAAVLELVQKSARCPTPAVADLAEEILALLPHQKLLSATKTDGGEERITDFTLSYLDHVVVDAMRSRDLNPFAIEPFDVLGSERPRSSRSGKEELKLTPYQQLDEESLSRISEPMSPQELDDFAIPNVWSAKGRISKAINPGAQEGSPEDSTQSSLQAVLTPKKTDSSLDDFELNKFS